MFFLVEVRSCPAIFCCCCCCFCCCYWSLRVRGRPLWTYYQHATLQGHQLPLPQEHGLGDQASTAVPGICLALRLWRSGKCLDPLFQTVPFCSIFSIQTLQPVPTFLDRWANSFNVSIGLNPQAGVTQIPTVTRDIIYGWARGLVGPWLLEIFAPTTFFHKAFEAVKTLKRLEERLWQRLEANVSNSLWHGWAGVSVAWGHGLWSYHLGIVQLDWWLVAAAKNGFAIEVKHRLVGSWNCFVCSSFLPCFMPSQFAFTHPWWIGGWRAGCYQPDAVRCFQSCRSHNLCPKYEAIEAFALTSSW